MAVVACLSLAGAFALPTVQADTTDNGPHGSEHTHFYLWRTTMTVGVLDTPQVILYGYRESFTLGSISTDADFGFPPWNPPHKHHVDRDGYITVGGIWVNIGDESLNLEMPELTDTGNVTLWLGHKRYPLSSETYGTSGYTWADVDLDWEADDPDTTDVNEADQVRVALVYERQLPSAPENVQVTAPTGEDGTLEVSWDAADDGTFPIECYLVEFRHPSGEAKKRKQSYPGSLGTGKGCGDTPPTSVTRTDLETGVQYQVLVQALSGDGYSEWSDMKTARTNQGRALQGRFLSPPERHDGKKRIKVRVEFSEAPENVGADGVEVEGGRVTSVRPVGGNAPGGAGNRSAGGRNAGREDREVWEFEIEPDSDGDVTVSLDAGRPCGEPGAICTADGRSLSEGISTTVEGPDTGPAGLTASFEDVPAAHDGESAFTLRIASSDRLSMMNGRRLREDVVAVSGGRATSAGRVDRRRDLWKLTVEPDSLADVTVTVAAGAACGTPAAVCTKDGRALSNTISATVRGPVGIAVADAHVEEDAGAVLAFAVTLSRAASGTLTVDYATSDGSAQAGVDYTAASGTLTFQAGESSRTIEVGVLDDAHDEGEETLTLTSVERLGRSADRRRGYRDDREPGPAAAGAAGALRADGGGARGRARRGAAGGAARAGLPGPVRGPGAAARHGARHGAQLPAPARRGGRRVSGRDGRPTQRWPARRPRALRRWGRRGAAEAAR